MDYFNKILLTAFVIIVYVSNINAQQARNESFPLTIAFLEIYDLDTTYKPTWESMTIPPNWGYQIDDYIYKLIITITVIGEEIWNEPFTLVYELPGHNREFVVINEERFELLPDRFNEILVEVHTKQKGWVKFELAMIDELTGEILIPVNSYPLRRRDFLLE